MPYTMRTNSLSGMFVAANRPPGCCPNRIIPSSDVFALTEATSKARALSLPVCDWARRLGTLITPTDWSKGQYNHMVKAIELGHVVVNKSGRRLCRRWADHVPHRVDQRERCGRQQDKA